MMPFTIATATAPAIFEAPSLWIIACLWAFAVRLVMPRLWAICRAVFPFANKVKTSISRGVRGGVAIDTSKFPSLASQAFRQITNARYNRYWCKYE